MAAAAARPATAYEATLALAAPVKVAYGATPVPLQDANPRDVPVADTDPVEYDEPALQTADEPVADASVDVDTGAVHEEKDSIHEV